MLLPWSRDVVVAWCWDAGERALKTGAQVAVAALGAQAAIGAVPWNVVGPEIVYAMLLSVLTSVASAKGSQPGSASFIDAKAITYQPRHASVPVTSDHGSGR